MFFIKRIIFCVITISFCFQLFSQQTTENKPITWLTFEEGMAKSAIDRKPLFIDVYTDWCSWCKVMMTEAFIDPAIVNYLNSNYLPVRFNAESSTPVNFSNKTFVDTIISNKHIHQLAIALLDARPAYPTLVYITRDGKKFAVPGYQKAPGLLPYLVYYNEGIYNSKVTNTQFKDQFAEVYPVYNNLKINTIVDGIKWIKLEEALANLEKPDNKKKLFIDLYVDSLLTTGMMLGRTYNNQKIREILDEYFYCVRINAKSKETLTFGQAFENKNQWHGYHDIAIAMLQGKMVFPAALFFDEQSKLVHSAQTYFDQAEMLLHLRYIIENQYTKTTWDDFYKFNTNP